MFPAEGYVQVLILRTHECQLNWKRGLCSYNQVITEEVILESSGLTPICLMPSEKGRGTDQMHGRRLVAMATKIRAIQWQAKEDQRAGHRLRLSRLSVARQHAWTGRGLLMLTPWLGTRPLEWGEHLPLLSRAPETVVIWSRSLQKPAKLCSPVFHPPLSCTVAGVADQERTEKKAGTYLGGVFLSGKWWLALDAVCPTLVTEVLCRKSSSLYKCAYAHTHICGII